MMVDLKHSTVCEIAMAMQCIKTRLAEAGLFATMQAMDVATQKLGWEAADILSGVQRATQENER